MPSTKMATLGSMVVLPAAPMPRMLMRRNEDWTPLVAWKFDATRPRSWTEKTLSSVSCSPVKAAIEIGTSWRFSLRRCAVTTISSDPVSEDSVDSTSEDVLSADCTGSSWA